MGRGNESLFVKSGLHDQDGRHAHIWLHVKPLKNLLHRSRQGDFHENRYVASMTPAHHNLINDDPWMTFMRGSRHFYERGSNQNGKILSQTNESNPKKIPKLPFLR